MNDVTQKDTLLSMLALEIGQLRGALLAAQHLLSREARRSPGKPKIEPLGVLF